MPMPGSSRTPGALRSSCCRKGASVLQARLLAQKENQADLIGGVNLGTKDLFLARTLLDLSQTATINDSLKLGKYLLGELGSINTLHKTGVEQAGFAVLKAPDIPSALIETAFISNPEEEARLNDDAYREKLAGAIVRGIRQYFIKHPPGPKAKLAVLGCPRLIQNSSTSPLAISLACSSPPAIRRS